MGSCLPDEHRNSLARIESGYWWYLARIRWAQRMFADWIHEQNTHVGVVRYVDLGCGTGGFAYHFSRCIPHCQTALVDMDPVMLRQSERWGDCIVLQRDFNAPFDLPWSADIITCMDVLEHIEEEAMFLQHVVRHLRPGGLLILSVPAHPFLFSGWDRRLGHHRRYTAPRLRAVLEEAGLDIRYIRHMWSLLAPLVLYRKITHRDGTSAEFPIVSSWLNKFLVRFSDIEWYVSRFLPFPIGTSVIVSATKS